MEHRAPRDVDEEAPVVLVDGHQESAVGRGGEAGYVGGGGEVEGDGVVLGEVGDGDAVADGGDEMGVLCDDGVSASVGSAEKVLESVIHGLRIVAESVEERGRMEMPAAEFCVVRV